MYGSELAMRTNRALTERLRDQIESGIHVGHLAGGDRRPSIRRVSQKIGADARAVARAYRDLEAEGLVEVRERAGIYAAPQAGFEACYWRRPRSGRRWCWWRR